MASNSDDKNRRSQPSNDTDIFDDIWSSITDTASEFTRSLVGLPMFYRHTENPIITNRADVLTVFAEPGILSPKVITFHLDRDASGIMGPFRFISRPVTVFDIISQGWWNDECGFGSGMMFLFGSPIENARWLASPGLMFTGNSMFRQRNNHDEWIRKSTKSAGTSLNVGFDDFDDGFKSLSNELDRRSAEMRRRWLEDTGELPKPETKSSSFFEDFEKRFEERFKRAKEDDAVKSYSTETSMTTHITRSADGSIHKETITTEWMPDGSTKTTRIVNTTPAGSDAQQSRTETTVNTTPPAAPSIQEKPWPRPRIEEAPKFDTESVDKGNSDHKNWAWWFWSRK